MYRGMIGLHTCAVAETGAEPVRHGRNPKLADQPPQLLFIEWLPAPKGEDQMNTRGPVPSPRVRPALRISRARPNSGTSMPAVYTATSRPD